MRDAFLLWHDWQRLAARLGSERHREIAVLRCRAQRHMHALGRQNLVTLGAHLGLFYPHLLDTALLRVALNPFYPWGGHVPASISDIALHRLVHTATGDGAAGWPQIRHKVERGTALLQSRLDERDRPGAFRVFRALHAPALLLTVHAWQDPLLDLVSQQGAWLLSPKGIIPPLLLSLMARDLGGPVIRLRCPVCCRVLTPDGLCRVHGRQDLYAAWR